MVHQAGEGGRYRPDFDRSFIDELGFSFGMWNRRSDAAAALSVHVGSWATNPVAINSVVLDLPAADGAGARLYESGVAEALVQAAAEAWDPEWAMFASMPQLVAQETRSVTPRLGWLTYLSVARSGPEVGRTAHRDSLRAPASTGAGPHGCHSRRDPLGTSRLAQGSYVGSRPRYLREAV